MPELPDLTVYLECPERRILGRTLERVRVAGPSWLRSVDPPIAEFEERTVRGLRRLGKRIVIEVEGELLLVLHLMIAGRLRWKRRGAKIPARVGLGGFYFSNGTLLLTEAGTKSLLSGIGNAYSDEILYRARLSPVKRSHACSGAIGPVRSKSSSKDGSRSARLEERRLW